jgi:23S rRNA (uracil1939-C5)-methyltransferase
MVFGEYQPESIYLVMDFLKETFAEIKSLTTSSIQKQMIFSELEPILYAGQEVIYEQIENLKFRIGPLSFFQTNTSQAKRLYQIAGMMLDCKVMKLFMIFIRVLAQSHVS